MSPAQVPETEIRAQQDRSEKNTQVSIVLDHATVAAGDGVSGSVTLTPEKEWRVDRCTVSFAFEIAYFQDDDDDPGSMRHQVAEERLVVLEGERVGAGQSVTRPFEFRVPARAPGTFAVPNGAVAYGVRAEVKLKRAIDPPPAAREVTVTWAGLDPSAEVGEPTRTGESNADLEVTGLSSRVLQPGDVVSGTVLIKPNRSAEVKGAHVGLNMAVVSGEGLLSKRRTSVSIEIVRQPLAVPQRLEEGQSVALPFSLEVPSDIPAASVGMKLLTVAWGIVVEVDTKGLLRGNPRLAVPVLMRTGLGGTVERGAGVAAQEMPGPPPAPTPPMPGEASAEPPASPVRWSGPVASAPPMPPPPAG